MAGPGHGWVGPPPPRRPAWRDVMEDPRDTRIRAVLGTVGACLVSAFSSLVAVSYAGNAATQVGASQLLPVLGMLAALAVAVSLAWRRRHPVQVCLGTALTAVVLPLDAFAPLLALTWVIARRPRNEALGCGAAAAVATGVSLWRDAARPVTHQFFTGTAADGSSTYLTAGGYVALGTLLLAIAVAVGLARRNAERARAATGVAADSARTVVELRGELSRQEERDLVAREMHDSVAHGLSLVSLQASALEATAGDPGADVPAAARSIRDSAHRALEEMRVLVASLRDASTAGAGPGPAPAFAELPRLIDEARAAGAAVSATLFVSDQHQAPAVLTRAVYRIVQESLTNALKHAPGAPVEVDVRAGSGTGVDVVVRNRIGPAQAAQAPQAAAVPGAGAGVRGMAERVQALGGTFAAGPADGWFVVHAQLPWAAPAR